MIWKHSKTTLDHLFRNVTRCSGRETISSSKGPFWRSAPIKSWIPTAIHYIQLLDYSMNTMVRELRSICKEFELNWILLRILLSHFQSHELQRCHKQAGCCISPSHHVANTELQILVYFSSNFVAIFILCLSVVRLKRNGNYFKWIEIVISSMVQSLTFQLKANDCVWTNFVYLFTC